MRLQRPDPSVKDTPPHMAKLHFFYSVMNAGKSTHLLQARYNYSAMGFETLLFTSARDDRNGVGRITSRLGLSEDARALGPEDNIFDIVAATNRGGRRDPRAIVFIDEVQFLTPDQIRQASDIVDDLRIPVMTYGLKNNILGELFSPAIATVLAYADAITEHKAICHCGRKATMILRFDGDGRVARGGQIVQVGGEESYSSVCRPCFKAGEIGPVARRALVENSGGRFREYCGPVVCSTCDKVYESMPGMAESQQAYHCSATANASGITGHYGSTVADGDHFVYTAGRPPEVRNGNICDACITGLRDRGAIKRESSFFDDEYVSLEEFEDVEED